MDDIDLDALEQRMIDLHRLWTDAERAGVPWSYRLSLRARTDPDYQRWLAHVYVCRLLSVDPHYPPTVLGPAPLRPTILNQGDLERDLDALGDFGVHPLHDFVERRSSAVGPERGTNRDRPVPPE